jgi:hypothetical protein
VFAPAALFGPVEHWRQALAVLNHTSTALDTTAATLCQRRYSYRLIQIQTTVMHP